MIKNKIKQIVLSLGLLMIVSSISLHADIDRNKYGKDADKLQSREVTGVFDLQKNTVSNIEFYTTNYGIFGFNIAQRVGGGIWPRGSRNQYIFAGGVWFGAQKKQYDTSSQRRKYVSVTYNPNSGISWMVPGRINVDGPAGAKSLDLYDYDASNLTGYRTYFSTDFVPSDGSVRGGGSYESWPIWDASKKDTDTLQFSRYFGYYVEKDDDRTLASNPRGPAFISGEDIFSTYKDTDLSRYEGGEARRLEEGYPLELQYEQMIYSWGFGDYKDFIFLKYEITNYSEDTLWDCWLAPVMDIDIALQPNTSFGAGNDRTNFYTPDTTLNLAYQWSNTDRGEKGKGFGYLGFDFLESPAIIKYHDTTIVDQDTIITERLPKEGEELNNFVRKDKKVFPNWEQLGLVTFRNWSIEDDKLEDNVRYNYISAGVRDGDTGPGDKRFMMATGPFHMRPHDTVRVVVGLVVADPAVNNEPDGSEPDLAELVRKDIFMQAVYDNNFLAPRPPDRCVITEKVGYNNATMIKWDSTSVLSNDKVEKGLDFLGYRIYRSRRPELDTFSVYSTETTGPFGWKEIAQYELPKPFVPSSHRSGRDDNDPAFPFIDSLRILGPYVDENGNILDSNAIVVMRIPKGVMVTDAGTPIYYYNEKRKIIDSAFVPRIISPRIRYNREFEYLADQDIWIDTSYNNKPWGPNWFKLWKESNDNFIGNYVEGSGGNYVFLDHGDREYRPGIENKLWDEMVGVLVLNSSLQSYNPLFFKKSTISISPSLYNIYREKYPEGLVVDANVTVVIVGEDTTENTEYYVDSVLVYDSFRKVNIDGSIKYIMDILTKNKDDDGNYTAILRDSLYLQELNQNLYQFIKEGKVKNITFTDFQNDSIVRHDIMVPYMNKITNNNTFYDIGDDNNDAVISASDDPTETERMINNIDYYYKVLAYDEGDYLQPTEYKQNDGSEGLPNFAQIYPTAADVSENVEFEIIHVDSNLIGGLRNFNFYSVDLQRTLQQFAGHTLELKFEPYWSVYDLIYPGTGSDNGISTTLYETWVTLKDVETKELLYRSSIRYEVIPCNYSFRGWFTEDAQSYIYASNSELLIDSLSGETITFNQPNSYEIRDREGTFFTGDFNNPGFCNTYGFRPGGYPLKGYGTIGFSFDYYISQYGGIYRSDKKTNEIAKAPGEDATTPVKASESPAIKGGVVTYDPNTINYGVGFMDGGFNNGPGVYEIEFLPGGTETMELQWNYSGNSFSNKATFNVDYLTIKVTNKLTKEIILSDGQHDQVDYPNELQHINIPYSDGLTIGTGLEIENKSYPYPTNLGLLPGSQYPIDIYTDYKLITNEYIGKYNLSSYGWIDSRGVTPFRMERAYPMELPEEYDFVNVGQQGRYYLSAKSTDGAHQLDFTNGINIGGAFFGFDYANSGKYIGPNDLVREDVNTYTYGPDFQVGDKVTLQTFGGAFGLPLPGATVLVKISDKTPVANITDELMDDIKVVPNPYYISHQGVKSPYDNKLYFTRLPERATIDIYTINGELVISLDHDAYNSEDSDRKGVKVWDLMSKNKQRVQSQGFIAVIKTPDGAETVKKFSVVVGGFNLNDKVVE